MIRSTSKGHVLITGGSGYLGSNLARRLSRLGYRVTVLLREKSSIERLADVECSTLRIDSTASVAALLNSCQPIDLILHTATSYGRAAESVYQIFSTNTVFAVQLLEAAITIGVPQFINAGTALRRSTNAYALSKGQFVEWGRLLGKSASISFVDVALEHMYGPGDSDTKFTTMVIRRCLGGQGSLRLTKGEQLRDFIYIDDVLDAFVTVIESTVCRTNGFHQFQVGSGVPVSVRKYVELAKSITKSEIELQFGVVSYRANEPMRSIADLKMIRKLGWEPKWTLEKGIGETVRQERWR